MYESFRYFQWSFKSTGLLIQEKKFKIDFQNGCYCDHLGFPIRIILAISDLQISLILPIKFQVNRPFRSGEEVQNIFSRWWLWQPYWISNRTILAIFDLQNAQILPTKFWVNWPFGLGEKVQSRFLRQPSRWPSWISDRNDFSCFDLQVIMIIPTKFRVSLLLVSAREE